MNIFKKIKNWIVFSLPYGMKAADAEIFGFDRVQDGHQIVINQQVEDKTVAKHLLKGEVTQPVEELRYRTYKVDDEAKLWVSDGTGAMQKTERKTRDGNKIKFSQFCKKNIATVNEELARADKEYGLDTYTVEVGYLDFVRFKIEAYLKQIDVLILKDEERYETTLRFSEYPNEYDQKTVAFIKELKKLENISPSDKVGLGKIDFLNYLNSISFSTYKATNEDDFVNYAFTTSPEFIGLKKENGEYLLTLKWENYMRVPLDILQKYYSESMELKYQRKEKKDVISSDLHESERHFCEICGKEVSDVDVAILEASKLPILCSECLKTNNITLSLE